jgi:hypothetical protein
MRHMFELVPVCVVEAANEPWLAFPQRNGVTVTQVGEYTRVVLTKSSSSELPLLPRPAWA